MDLERRSLTLALGGGLVLILRASSSFAFAYGSGKLEIALYVASLIAIGLASVLAALGFFILPAKREKAKGEMRRKIGGVRQRLSDALRAQFAQEISKSVERIRESIAPYSRFVRAEGEKLRTTEQELREIGVELASLRARIDKRAA